MFKKYTIVLLSLYYTMHISAWHATPQEEPHATNASRVVALPKDQQLGVLKKIAADINAMHELREYTLTVPPFIILTNQDIIDFLSNIQSPYQPKQRRFARKIRAISLFDYLHNAWQDVIRSIHKKKMSNATHTKLNDIRDALDLAFKQQLVTSNKALAHFVKSAQLHNSTLIMRSLTQLSGQKPTNVHIAQPDDINKALRQVIASYYDDESVEHMLQHDTLPTDPHFSIIVQSFVASDEQEPSVAGVSCSYNPIDHNQHIITIQTVYGHHAGLKNQALPHDIYYVLNNMVYPIIHIKQTRLEQQAGMPEVMLVNNDPVLAQRSSLDPTAAKDIASVTQALENKYKQPVCLYFIKQEHTLYLISFELVSPHEQSSTNFIDPAYIKKAVKDDAVTITPLQPIEHILVIKDPQTILLAHDAQELLQKYDPDNQEITVCILEQSPAEWSAQKKLLDQLPVPTFYSPSSTHIQLWINKNLSPLVIDCQAQLIFPYKRRKSFCTLYHTIINGLLQPSFVDNLSVINEFFTPLSAQEKDTLRPEEFFSGVTMKHLFDLLRCQQPDTALRALRSILYRLHIKIKRIAITTQEKSKNQETSQQVEQLQKQYAYIQTVAYQLYKKMYEHIKAKTEQSCYDRDQLFLINVLKSLITQNDNKTVIRAVSFDALTGA